MKNLTTSNRLMLMIGASVMAILIVGIVGISIAKKGTESIRKINDGSMASIQMLADARQKLMEITVNGRAIA